MTVHKNPRMSGVETRSKRKRNRPVTFDLERSTFIENKKYRKYRQNHKMAEGNPTVQPQFTDMSYTINAPNRGMEHFQGSQVESMRAGTSTGRTNEALDSSIQEMVSQSVSGVQEQLRAMVTETVSQEMKKVYDMMEKINQTVKDLSDGRVSTSGTNEFRSTNETPIIQQHVRIPPPPDVNYTVPTTVSNPINQVNKTIHVDKFGLNFDGKPSSISVDDFIFRLEHLQKHYQLPWSNILGEFHQLVSGEANEWYWLQVESNMIPDWESLKYELRERYRSQKTNFDFMRELMERKQQHGESIDHFFHALKLLRMKLLQPISELELIKIAKTNIRENIKHLVYPMSVASLEELRVECIGVERNFPRRDMRGMMNVPVRPQRSVSEIETGLPESSPRYGQNNVEEVIANTSHFVCWNCKRHGHGFRECPSNERSLFCYRCGQPDTTTPNCVRCQSGNSRRNVIRAGDQRSTQNLARARQ